MHAIIKSAFSVFAPDELYANEHASLLFVILTIRIEVCVGGLSCCRQVLICARFVASQIARKCDDKYGETFLSITTRYDR